MTREETKHAISIMRAYVDGKEIELNADGKGYWCDKDDPNWDWSSFEYRIKEEPKPFDWRGKNIQWVRIRHNFLASAKVLCLNDAGLYFIVGHSIDPEIKLFKWNILIQEYEWSEDNATWRKFE